MRNPFRSEDAAFRFVGLTIGYFALIVGGAAINRWLGLAVFVLETAAIAVWFTRHDEVSSRWNPPSGSRLSGERRVLVVANETVAGPELLAELKRQAAGTGTRVLVVCPALNSPVKHWVSDEDGARDDARARLEASLEAMRAVGIEAQGEIGDDDPLQAIEDALRTFAPDEIVISTHPEGRSNWLERGVVGAARERFSSPVTHVVVDLEARRSTRAGALRPELDLRFRASRPLRRSGSSSEARARASRPRPRRRRRRCPWPSVRLRDLRASPAPDWNCSEASRPRGLRRA